MTLSLSDRLLKWLKSHPGWHPKGELLKLVAAHTNYTSENAGRRLRELENEKLIEVDYRKGHAWYRAAAKPLSQEEWFDQLPTDRTEKIKFGARDFAERFTDVMRDL